MVVNDVSMSHMVYIWEPSNSGTVVNAVNMIHSLHSGEVFLHFNQTEAEYVDVTHGTSHHLHIF